MLPKRLLALTLFAALAAMPPCVLRAQWVQTNGPYGTYVSCFAVSGTNLFAGSGIGVFLTTDNGTSWTAVNSGLNSKHVQSLAASGTNLFCGTGDSGVFISTDNGVSWNATNDGLANREVLALTVSGSDLLAMTWDGNNDVIYLSTNNGIHWTRLNTPTQSTEMSIALIGTDLFVANSNAGSPLGVYVSTNIGTTWTKINSGLTDSIVYHLAVSGTNLFAATESGRVFRWIDSMRSWTFADSGLHSTFVYNLWASGTSVFTQTADSVFRTTNNGSIWLPFTLGPGKDQIINTTALIGNHLFAATEVGGIVLSTDDGSSWTPVNTGIRNTPVSCLALSGKNLFAGSMGYSIGPFLSTDEGASWSQVNDLLWTAHVRSLAAIGTNILAGIGGGDDGSIFRSTDDGISWTNVYPGFPDYDIYQAFAAHEGNLFAGSAFGSVLRSTDSGRSWAKADTTGLQNFRGGITSFAVLGNNLFAGTVDSGIFLSTNNGASWTQINNGLWNTQIRALAVSGTTIIAATNILGDDYGGIFISTNNGGSWTRIVPEMTSYCTVDAFAVSGTNIFASTSFGTPCLSTDFGLSWRAVDSGLPRTHITSLLASNTNLFAGTDSSVWRRPLSEMIGQSAVTQETAFQKDIQSYPNPFNASTTIGFALSEQGFVQLDVFDMLGRTVQSLLNETMEPGQHSTRFDADNLASGIYTVVLSAGSSQRQIKLILSK